VVKNRRFYPGLIPTVFLMCSFIKARQKICPITGSGVPTRDTVQESSSVIFLIPGIHSWMLSSYKGQDGHRRGRSYQKSAWTCRKCSHRLSENQINPSWM